MGWMEAFERRLNDGTAWTEGFTVEEVMEKPVDIGDRWTIREGGRIVDELQVCCMYPGQEYAGTLDMRGRYEVVTFKHVLDRRDPR